MGGISKFLPFGTSGLLLHASHLLKGRASCGKILTGNIPQYGRGSHMNVEELKARLRALLHQRDMLRFERDSLELFDLLEEVDEEIQELQRQIRKIA